MSRLFLLFVFVPLIELALLIRLGSVIGFWPTVAIVVGTAAIGSSLARREGLSAFARFQEALAGQRPLGRELMDGLIILASAVLLLTPGILTDIVGLLGLFPTTRPLIRSLIRNNIDVAVVGTGTFNPDMSRSSASRQSGNTQEPGETVVGKPPDGGYETTMSGTAAEQPSYRDTTGEHNS